MKKVLKFTDIDCANCAAKIERNINKLEEVNSASVGFLAKKIVVEFNDDIDFDDLLKKIEKEVKKVEPDCDLII